MQGSYRMPIKPPRAAPPPQQQYELVPQRPPVRWNIWLADGPAEIDSSNSSLGNRLEFGGDANLLKEDRLILGVTMLDLLSSGEYSTDVGGISRFGFDLRVGTFLVPDKLYIEYGLYLGNVEGSNIIGWTGAVGHSVNLGWKFYANGPFNLALQAGYEFIGSQTVATFDPSTSATGTSTYPRANIYSVSVRVGFDIAGKG